MKSWKEFSTEESELSEIGRKLLFPTREYVGRAFIATMRKDGAPRLHPVSLVISQGHLYVMIPPTSPKCADLIRDGRFAMQAYPPLRDEEDEEFYIAGCADRIQDTRIRQALMDNTKVVAEESEVLFELFLDRVMYTRLVDRGTPDKHPIHQKWQASSTTSQY